MSSAFDVAERGLGKLQAAQRMNAENEEIATMTTNQLYSQGDQLNNADKLAMGLQDDTARGSKLLKELKWRLFKEKLCMYMMILILLGADIGLALYFFHYKCVKSDDDDDDDNR